MTEVGICVALILLATSCFQSPRGWVRKIGLWIIFCTLGLGIWFWTESWVMVTAALFAWFAIPIGQAIMMSRRLRFSTQRKLHSGYFDLEEFPDLHPSTQSLREAGFVLEGDHWLKPSPIDQGFRIFTHRHEPVYAAIAVVRQGAFNILYHIFASEDSDGTIWLTWDYPLAYGLKLPPELQTFRYVEADSPAELYEMHRNFLELNEIASGTTPPSENAIRFFDQIFKSTLNYNLSTGLLRPTEFSKNEIQYSWRGTCFITWQVFCEMIKG